MTDNASRPHIDVNGNAFSAGGKEAGRRIIKNTTDKAAPSIAKFGP